MGSFTANRRVVMLAGAVAIAGLVLVAAILISQSGTTDEVDESERVALFDGIPQDAAWLGAADAPVVVEEFADPQCPFCADFALRNLPAIVRDYVRPGDVRMRLRVLTFLGPDSVEAARVAVAAGEQDREWDFMESLYARQGEEGSGYVTEDFLRDVAADVRGLDIDRALEAARTSRVEQALRADAQAAQRAGVQSTPTFLVGRRGGAMRAVSAEELPAAIAAALEA
jgi:protein-disulfide isomerase